VSSDSDALRALVLQTPPGALPARRAEAQPRERTGKSPHFDAWLSELERFLPAPDAPELDEYYRCALMGVVVGFEDRNLSPYLEQHTAIVPPLLTDIRTVYEQVRRSGAQYSPEEFVFRAFDYGIHKAYYLDWQLYLSQELY
jgi:hypothetical protein